MVTVRVFGSYTALVNSMGTGLRNLPVSFPSRGVRTTVTAVAIPPFGVQSPDQVPSRLVAVSAAVHGATSASARRTRTGRLWRFMVVQTWPLEASRGVYHQ